jgi:hypothetical protein
MSNLVLNYASSSGMHPHTKCNHTIHAWALEGNGRLNKHIILVVDRVCGLWLTTHHHKELKERDIRSL